MSWEEMYTCTAVCPCGKGKITRTSYGDDWNRYKDGPVVIECVECAKKYLVRLKQRLIRISERTIMWGQARANVNCVLRKRRCNYGCI